MVRGMNSEPYRNSHESAGEETELHVQVLVQFKIRLPCKQEELYTFRYGSKFVWYRWTGSKIH